MFFELANTLLGLLVSLAVIAFFILGERKILGYAQARKGPNKVGYIGLLQSFADLAKLVIKIKFIGHQSRSVISLFGVGALVALVVSYCCIYGTVYSGFNYGYSCLWLLAITGFSSYALLGVGWGSYSSYGFVGAARSAFGSVSFETVFMCLVIFYGSVCCSYCVGDFLNYGHYSVLISPIIYVVFLISVLGETNRTPFDYAESESELVSGFNTEYSGILFTCLFACEYVVIYILSWFISACCFGGGSLFYTFLALHLLGFMWARATLPRVRYDYFIGLFWSYLLPISILSLFAVCYL